MKVNKVRSSSNFDSQSIVCENQLFSFNKLTDRQKFNFNYERQIQNQKKQNIDFQMKQNDHMQKIPKDPLNPLLLQNYLNKKKINIDDYCVIGELNKNNDRKCFDFSKKIMLVLQVNDKKKKIYSNFVSKRKISFDDNQYLHKQNNSFKIICKNKKKITSKRTQSRQQQPYMRRKSLCDIDNTNKQKQNRLKIYKPIHIQQKIQLLKKKRISLPKKIKYKMKSFKDMQQSNRTTFQYQGEKQQNSSENDSRLTKIKQKLGNLFKKQDSKVNQLKWDESLSSSQLLIDQFQSQSSQKLKDLYISNQQNKVQIDQIIKNHLKNQSDYQQVFDRKSGTPRLKSRTIIGTTWQQNSTWHNVHTPTNVVMKASFTNNYERFKINTQNCMNNLPIKEQTVSTTKNIRIKGRKSRNISFMQKQNKSISSQNLKM